MSRKNKPMSFYPPPYSQHVVKSTFVLLINGVYTLINVVIIDFTQVDLVSWVALSWGVVSIIATSVKDGFYHD